MKRIYQSVQVESDDRAWLVLLDRKPLRTPARHLLALPNQDAALAIAAEWDAQRDTVDPKTMPLMQLAATALDWVAPNRETVINLIADYAETDLVCYRADKPPALAARQQEAWQPLVDWAALRYDAPFAVTSGVMPRPQPPEVRAAIKSALQTYDPLPLTAVHGATAACGSVVIGLALITGTVGADAAWRASLLDELFQAEQWGEDIEAAKRRASLRADIDSAARFFRLVGDAG